MDRDTEKQYEAMFEMYSTDGWKIFVEDLEKACEGLRDVITTNPLQDFELYEMRGEFRALSRIKNHELFVRNSYDQAQEETGDFDADL